MAGGGGRALGWCWATQCPPECPHCAAREGEGSAGIVLAPPRHPASMGTPGKGLCPPGDIWGEGEVEEIGRGKEVYLKKPKQDLEVQNVTVQKGG